MIATCPPGFPPRPTELPLHLLNTSILHACRTHDPKLQLHDCVNLAPAATGTTSLSFALNNATGKRASYFGNHAFRPADTKKRCFLMTRS